MIYFIGLLFIFLLIIIGIGMLIGSIAQVALFGVLLFIIAILLIIS